MPRERKKERKKERKEGRSDIIWGRQQQYVKPRSGANDNLTPALIGHVTDIWHFVRDQIVPAGLLNRLGLDDTCS